MEQKVLSVSQINEYIRNKMDADPLLLNLAVRGEISNYKMYPSGHHYFTIKDDGAALKCVMFRGNAMRLRFRPDNGIQVIALGKISVYPRDGAYQLYCTGLVLDGVGDLYAAFEQLKARLSEKGLFDPAHKKPLPQYPGVIGIITSSAGAAIHDMLRILRKRYPLTTVKLLPVRVQGTEAPAEIAGAIRYADHYKLADLLIVGRGGGSIEDLWAFNDEMVAQAIYECNIPVISAVGHEPDVTISDFVADMRAATPSNAAELAVPDQDALRQNLDTTLSAMTTSVLRRLKASRQQFDALSQSPVLQNPEKYIDIKRKELKLISAKLLSISEFIINRNKQTFVSLTAKLDAMSPLKVLSRGYSMTLSAEGDIIRTVHQVSVGDEINLRLCEGQLKAKITEIKECSHEYTK